MTGRNPARVQFVRIAATKEPSIAEHASEQTDDNASEMNASMRTTQALLNHSADQNSAIRKRSQRALVGETIDTRSRLPAETIVTLAMTQRRVDETIASRDDSQTTTNDSSCDTD